MTTTFSRSALRGRLGDGEVLTVLDGRAESDAGENVSRVALGPNNCAATRDAIN